MSRDPMKTRLSRRQALGALGTVSLGGLLAACGDDDAGVGAKTDGDGIRAVMTFDVRKGVGATQPGGRG